MDILMVELSVEWVVSPDGWKPGSADGCRNGLSSVVHWEL